MEVLALSDFSLLGPGANTFLLSQILAAMALGFGLVSYQFKATRWILLVMLICNLLSASHFLLLDRPGPAALQLVTAARFSVAVFTTDRRIMVLFLVATAGIFYRQFREYAQHPGLCRYSRCHLRQLPDRQPQAAPFPDGSQLDLAHAQRPGSDASGSYYGGHLPDEQRDRLPAPLQKTVRAKQRQR